MRFPKEIKDNGWKEGFTLLPVEIGDTTIWLERYLYRDEGIYTHVEFYEGCAERVGCPCDCLRHKK